jgi:hypothetical protein
MADFSFVTSRLATGAAIRSTADVDELAAAGITHCIDCRFDFDDRPLLEQRLAYEWNPTKDDGEPKPTEWFARSIDFALDALNHTRTRV